MLVNRDPKKYPKEGDVLHRFGSTRHVTSVSKKASGTLINVYFNAGTPDSQISSVSISTWRSWAKNDCDVLMLDETSSDRIAPRMIIATHTCGGLVASSWDDDDCEDMNKQNCKDWREKGYQVARISVPSGTPPMTYCQCNRGGK